MSRGKPLRRQIELSSRAIREPWPLHLANAGASRRHRNQRQLDETGLARRMVDPLCGLSIVTRLRPEDVGHEGLRIAIVKREPARLDLHHDPVAGQEDVVRGRQIEFVDRKSVV